MKKKLSFLLAMFCILMISACTQEKEMPVPDISQARNICELSTIECVYHTVSKYEDAEAKKFLWFTRGKHFWLEYDVAVKLGIDASLVDISVEETEIRITLPEAKVFSCEADESTVFLVEDKNSVKVTANDHSVTIEKGRSELQQEIEQSPYLLSVAKNRAQMLLTNYVQHFCNIAETPYNITWVYLDAEGNDTGRTATQTLMPVQQYLEQPLNGD